MRLKYTLYVLFFLLLLFFCSKSDQTYTIEMKDGVKYIHNHAPLWGDTLKVALEFVQNIGDLETEDENYQLYYPMDVARDKEGNIYILDSFNFRVAKFNSEGEFLTSFGKQGQGPGELSFPMAIQIDDNCNTYIFDKLNSRIQIFDLEGKPVKSIRQSSYLTDFILLHSGNILTSAPNESKDIDTSMPLVYIYDQNGNAVNEFGKKKFYKNQQMKKSGNSYFCVSDQEDNIYLAFNLRNCIEKYAPDGTLKMRVERDLGFSESPMFDPLTIVTDKRVVYTGKINVFSMGIGVDFKNRIWVTAFNRTLTEEDLNEEDTIKDGIVIEVYDSGGILLQRIPFPFPVRLKAYDMMPQLKRIYGDRVYFVDTDQEMCVYEYKIVEK